MPGPASAPAAVEGNGSTGLLAGAERTLEDLIGGKQLTPLIGLLAVLLSLLLGAAHAALPGHGKTVMAAYLVGSRGRPRDAVLVGATVTFTHTAGVIALGLLLTSVTTLAGESVLAWLGVASGTLVTGVGIGALTSALRRRHHTVANHFHPDQPAILVHAHTSTARHEPTHPQHTRAHPDHDRSGPDHDRSGPGHDRSGPGHGHSHPGHGHPRPDHGDSRPTPSGPRRSVSLGHVHADADGREGSHPDKDPHPDSGVILGHVHADSAVGREHTHPAGATSPRASHAETEAGHSHRESANSQPHAEDAGLHGGVRARTEHGHDHSHVARRRRAFLHGHHHGHSHSQGDGHDHGPGKWGIAGLGVAGGLVPSPSALIVLLGAAALGRTVFGVLLVLAYGLGMAATLTAAGLLLVRLRHRLEGRRRLADRWRAISPSATAALIIVVGLGLAGRALTGLA